MPVAAETEICREIAAAIMDVAAEEIEAAVTTTEDATVMMIVTEDATATETAAAIMTEDVTAMTTVTEDAIVTETAAAAEVPNPDRLLLLQILVDVKKSLFHNRLFFIVLYNILFSWISLFSITHYKVHRLLRQDKKMFPDCHIVTSQGKQWKNYGCPHLQSVLLPLHWE